MLIPPPSVSEAAEPGGLFNSGFDGHELCFAVPESALAVLKKALFFPGDGQDFSSTASVHFWHLLEERRDKRDENAERSFCSSLGFCMLINATSDAVVGIFVHVSPMYA